VRIVVIGASGLLGAHIADALRQRGHEVTGVARTARAGVDRALDVTAAEVGELRRLVAGHDGVVFAGRTEEQRPLRKPIYPVFRRTMVEPVVRLFTAAREEGVTRGVVLGSYYTYLERRNPRGLADRSTYVRCRLEQAREGRAAAGPGLPVAVLELPFVLGRAGERGPNWAGPLDRWARSDQPWFAPPGGTAMTSARAVAAVAADALDRAGGEDIPVADENLSWAEMFRRIAEATGHPRRIHRLPAAAVRVPLRLAGVLQGWSGRASGVDPGDFADLILAELFIEQPTGVSLEPAFRETFALRIVTSAG